MTHDDQIHELLAEAALLRHLPDDDPAKAPLTGIVDQINRLRHEQDQERKRALLEEPQQPTQLVTAADMQKLPQHSVSGYAPLLTAQATAANPFQQLNQANRAPPAAIEGADAERVRRKPGRPKKTP